MRVHTTLAGGRLLDRYEFDLSLLLSPLLGIIDKKAKGEIGG
jgi:hypothetical protein